MSSMLRGNRLESRVQNFWILSRAWKRDPQFVEGHTFQTIVDGLHPLITQGEWHQLRTQADDLVNLAVKGKIRRKRGVIKSKVIRVDFITKEVKARKTRKAGLKKVSRENTARSRVA